MNFLVSPNTITYLQVLMACAETAAIQQGKQVHAILKAKAVPIDNILGTALVNMYARSGDTENANQVLLHTFHLYINF
jgi:hypothetical protein